MRVKDLNISDFNTVHINQNIDYEVLARRFKRMFGNLLLWDIENSAQAQAAIDDSYVCSNFVIDKLFIIENAEYDVGDEFDYTDTTTHGHQIQDTKNLTDRTAYASGSTDTFNNTDTETRNNLQDTTTNPKQTVTNKKNTYNSATLAITDQTETELNANTVETHTGSIANAHSGTIGTANTGNDTLTHTGTDTIVNSGIDTVRHKGYRTPIADLLEKELELSKKPDPYDVLCGMLANDICIGYFE